MNVVNSDDVRFAPSSAVMGDEPPITLPLSAVMGDEPPITLPVSVVMGDEPPITADNFSQVHITVQTCDVFSKA